MDPDGRDALRCCQRGDCNEMAVVGMDAAGSDEADDVQPAVWSRLSGTRREEGRSSGERAVGDRGVDPGQVLEDGPAGTEVEVADLGVAHLAGRQPDGVLGRPEGGVRPRSHERAPGRHGRGGDRVGGRVGPDPEAIEDHEDDRAGPTCRSDVSPEASVTRGRFGRER